MLRLIHPPAVPTAIHDTLLQRRMSAFRNTQIPLVIRTCLSLSPPQWVVYIAAHGWLFGLGGRAALGIVQPEYFAAFHNTERPWA